MTNFRQILLPEQLTILRENGMISKEEIAFVTGDLLIAENALTNERRVVGESDLINETNRRVLKG
jgi:hypothetical protein